MPRDKQKKKMEFIFNFLKELIEIGDILFVNGNYLKEYHAFEILLSYSKNWNNLDNFNLGFYS